MHAEPAPRLHLPVAVLAGLALASIALCSSSDEIEGSAPDPELASLVERPHGLIEIVGYFAPPRLFVRRDAPDVIAVCHDVTRCWTIDDEAPIPLGLLVPPSRMLGSPLVDHPWVSDQVRVIRTRDWIVAFSPDDPTSFDARWAGQ